MNPICFYHKSDLDGVCSAAIVKHFVPGCELHGMDYGDEFPWDRVPAPRDQVDGSDARTVYMVDFSLKPDDMLRLTRTANLIWLDHHISAINGCAGIHPDISGLRRTDSAGCELAWEWFTYSSQPVELMPENVRLLGRYDVWAKDNPEWSRRILPHQYGARTLSGIYDPTALVWADLLSGGTPPEELISYGRSILSYLDQERREQVKRGCFELVLSWPATPYAPGRYTARAICLNTAAIGSGSFDSVWDSEKHDVMVMFCQLKSGKWRHGIYSTKPGIDCSVIAKAYGGGGHKGAAGCETDEPIVRPA